MKIIAGAINGQYLDEILENSISRTESVRAAVAYALHDPKLFSKCWENKIKLTFWGRYDYSIPVATPILKKFLDRKSPNYVCKLVPDIFHAKVIWWEGYGVYIGSANLTANAWSGNIEAGIFFTSDEIIDYEIEDELLSFFEEIDSLSHPLTNEIYEELASLEQKYSQVIKNHREAFNNSRRIKQIKPINFVSKSKSIEKRKNNFLNEWNETLQILRDIAARVSMDKNRPSWIEKNVPQGVQADQFLHAYYYSQVKVGTRALHHQYYEKHKNDPEKALVKAMSWWKSQETAPHHEDRMIYDWADYLYNKLSEDTILHLTEEEFIGVCSRIHALRDHALRAKYSTLGLDAPLRKMNADERIEYLGKWLYHRTTADGKSILEVVYYLLHGGENKFILERIWEVSQPGKWKIANLGIGTIGEIVGWAMPNDYPPRNGRTSKALTALGYPVRIHSE